MNNLKITELVLDNPQLGIYVDDTPCRDTSHTMKFVDNDGISLIISYQDSQYDLNHE